MAYGVIPKHLNWDAVDVNAPVNHIPAEHREAYVKDYGLPSGYGRFNEDFHGAVRRDFGRVYAAGNSPLEAVQGFCEERGWGRPDDMRDLEGSNLDWGYRFVANGTSFKAGGYLVPGGAILTWWS